MIQTGTPIQQQVDLTPVRLRKLMIRLAQLPLGAVYTITLIVPDNGEPMHSILPQGKLENYRHAQENMVR